MARIILNTGTTADDGTGTKLRDSMISVNSMTGELYANTASLTANVTSLTSNVTSLNANVTSLSANVTTLAANVTSLTANVSSLNANVTSIAANVATLSTGVSGLSSNVSYLTSVASPKPIANNYYAVLPYIGLNAGAAPVNTAIYFVPFFVAFTATVSSIATWITTAQASQTFGFAIYAHNPTTGTPTGAALASTGFSPSAAATGAVECPLISNFQLTPGIWWLGFQTSATTAVWQNGSGAATINTNNCLVGSPSATVVIAGAQATIQGWTYTNTYGTWPDVTGGSFGNHQTARGAAAYFKYVSIP